MKKITIILLSSFIFFWAASSGVCKETPITVFYINDLHGFALPFRPLGSLSSKGGAAFISSKVNQLRLGKQSLLLAAGDMLQGDNFANLFQGASIIELMNAMRFDAMVVGNHDFDFGQEVLKKRIAEANFSVLGGNVEGFPILQPFTVKQINNTKIAIIGITTQEIPVMTNPRNIAGLTFTSPTETVRKYVAELRPIVDLIVVLSHQGYNDDRILAEKVPGIDVIVGGHTHTKLLNPVKVNQTIIVQAYEHGQSLGVLDLTIEGGKILHYSGRLEEIDPSTIQADTSIQKIINKYITKIDSILSQALGRAEVDLEGSTVRSQETTLGNLIADSIREKSHAQVAVINGGSIRASIPKGVITRKDLYAALPFDNYIVAIRLTGREILELLEHGVSAVEQEAGRFPQVSGITFVYNKKAPVGSRIREVTIDGEPLQLDKVYVVATIDFLAAGGDGYRVFSQAISNDSEMLASKKLVYNDPSKWVREVVEENIKAQKIVSPSIEGRIKEIN